MYCTEGVLNSYTVNVTEKYSIIRMNHRASIYVLAIITMTQARCKRGHELLYFKVSLVRSLATHGFTCGKRLA